MLNIDTLTAEVNELTNKIVSANAIIAKYRNKVKELNAQADRTDDSKWDERLKLRNEAMDLSNSIYEAEAKVRTFEQLRTTKKDIIRTGAKLGMV
jgi:predicted RNase H-like nuclease (RuvC/YqgF family)